VGLEFQRARTPEQLAARRTAILETARELLAEKNVADISLRELSARVGLAKSNVLRYFDSREAVFLEILDDECGDWLTELENLLGRPRPRKPGYAAETRVATVIADSLVARPLLCGLIASMAGELERNISAEFAKDFKVRATTRSLALSALVARQLPWLPQESTDLFAEGALMLTAGMFPFSIPTDAVRGAMAAMDLPDPHDRFVDGMRAGLSLWLIGAAARGDA
jgi:AcrR family transcriptional regulator